MAKPTEFVWQARQRKIELEIMVSIGLPRRAVRGRRRRYNAEHLAELQDRAGQGPTTTLPVDEGQAIDPRV